MRGMAIRNYLRERLATSKLHYNDSISDCANAGSGKSSVQLAFESGLIDQKSLFAAENTSLDCESYLTRLCEYIEQSTMVDAVQPFSLDSSETDARSVPISVFDRLVARLKDAEKSLILVADETLVQETVFRTQAYNLIARLKGCIDFNIATAPSVVEQTAVAAQLAIVDTWIKDIILMIKFHDQLDYLKEVQDNRRRFSNHRFANFTVNLYSGNVSNHHEDELDEKLHHLQKV